MKERQILFSAPMVRAVLKGIKTKTRRIAALPNGYYWLDIDAGTMINNRGHKKHVSDLVCKYGQPGDRLWVRETWGVVSYAWNESGDRVEWMPDRPATPVVELPFGKGYYTGHVIYAADGTFAWAGDDDGGGESRSAWHPSIHMPRAASRITLEITGVRVERLNDISEADCIAEGCAGGHGAIPDYAYSATPHEHFRDIWLSLNGPGSWYVNPWVWVVEFKRIQEAA